MEEKILRIYFVEETDGYGDRSIVGHKGFFKESQANKLEAEYKEKLPHNYSFMIQELDIEFELRNGEPELPTIQGYYWVYIERLESVVVDYYRGNGTWSEGLGDQGDRFWGPIFPPKGLAT